MRPEQPQGETPDYQMGERLELQVTSIEETTGKFGKQLQIDGTLPAKNGWRGRAWIKYYPVPAPNQHLGKLCLAIQRVTGQQYTTLNAAIDALKSYGRIYVTVTGFNQVTQQDGSVRSYPKFRVYPDRLPGEQPQQTMTPKPALPQKPTLPTKVGLPEKPATPHEKMVAFIRRHVDLIGKAMPDTVWNEELALDDDLVQELVKEGLAYMKADEPYLDEKARQYV